jgi:hypothetical protein
MPGGLKRARKLQADAFGCASDEDGLAQDVSSISVCVFRYAALC